MILTVTVNPTLDKFYWVEELPLRLEEPEETVLIRSEKSSTSAGGKGINVAVFLAAQGVETVAMGFLGGHTGQIVLQDLLARGVSGNFLWIPGETRVNVTVLARGKEYHPLLIHEAGTPVPPSAIPLFLKKFERMARDAEYLVLGGALAPGLPVDFYRTLVEKASAYGVPTIVHAGGEAVTRALTARPFLVKPDVREELSFGDMPVRTTEEIIQAARRALELGVGACLVSHRLTGDVLVSPEEGVCFLEADVPVTEFRNLVGSDDALVGGLLGRLLAGDSLCQAARYGMGAAVASAKVEEKLCLDPEAIAREMATVSVRQVEGR